jgi:hypothetical protein
MKKTTKTVDTKKAAAEVKEAVAEVKKAVEPAVKKAAKAAEPAVKKAAETVAEVKKAAPKKAPAKKAAKPDVKFVLQYAGKDVTCKQMMEAAKSAWNGAEIKEVVFYVKPEENRVYFVVNGEEAGSFEI